MVPCPSEHDNTGNKNKKVSVSKFVWANITWKMLRRTGIDSLWPSDSIWQHRSGSTLAPVVACYLMVPSYDLNQCWLLRKYTKYLSLIWVFENYYSKMTATSTRRQWLKWYLNGTSPSEHDYTGNKNKKVSDSKFVWADITWKMEELVLNFKWNHTTRITMLPRVHPEKYSQVHDLLRFVVVRYHENYSPGLPFTLHCCC